MKPNIVIMHCHDLGRHLGCYGAGVETPNIDSIFRDGLLFGDYFSAAPMCSPSRSSAITGLYPVNHGLMGQGHFGWRIHAGTKTLPMYLNEAGYDTHVIGLQHEAVDPAMLGYKHYEYGLPNMAGYAPDSALYAIEALDAHDSSDGPIYLNVGFQEVHRWVPTGGWRNFVGTNSPCTFKPLYIAKEQNEGFGPTDCVVRVEDPSMVSFSREYDPREVLPLPHLPDRPGIREDIADIQAVITCVVDVMVGKILNKIKEKGMEENTLVVFSTDHGLDMPRAKGSLYDSGTGIALVMRYPTRFDHRSGVCRAMLGNVDLMPTILEIADVEPPDHIDGRSFLQVIDGGAASTRDELFAEMTWHGMYVPMRSIRTPRYKYIRNFHLQETSWTVYPESSAARELIGKIMMDFKPLEELYDLERDPNEQVNLASDRRMYSHFVREVSRDHEWRKADPEYDRVRHELSARLRTHMEQTHDPLLDGPIPHPGYACIWDEIE